MRSRRRSLVKLALLLFLALPACTRSTGTSGGGGDPPPNSLPVAATITVDNVGSSAWKVVKIEGDGATAGSGNNPTLTLAVGKRYRVVNNGNRFIHPFELITFASAATADVILLSQKEKTRGKLEGDAEVDFVEDDAGVTFTLTAALAQALSGYRCGVHTLTMRGAVSD